MHVGERTSANSLMQGCPCSCTDKSAASAPLCQPESHVKGRCVIYLICAARLHSASCSRWCNSLSSSSGVVTQADLEELGAGGEARRGGKRPARVLELETRERRHSLHIARVEQVLRLLENDQASSALTAKGLLPGFSALQSRQKLCPSLVKCMVKMNLCSSFSDVAKCTQSCRSSASFTWHDQQESTCTGVCR